MATIFCVLICLGTFADGSETENYRFGIFEDQGKKIEIANKEVYITNYLRQLQKQIHKIGR